MSIKVLIADEIASIRELEKMAFKTEVEIEVVGEAADANEAIRLAGALKPKALYVLRWITRFPNMRIDVREGVVSLIGGAQIVRGRSGSPRRTKTWLDRW